MDIGGSLTKIAYYSTVPFKKIAYDSIEAGQENEVRERVFCNSDWQLTRIDLTIDQQYVCPLSEYFCECQTLQTIR